MITKSDWQAANEQLMAEQRRKLGEPPTAETLLAYTRGELGPEEEERVREHLACNPDLARALIEPFPSEGAAPGDDDYLSDAEFEKHWRAMRKDPKHSEPRFWQFSAAFAAAVALVFGVLLWQASSRLRQPHVWEEQILLPDGRRGGESTLPVLTARGESVVLIASLIGPRDFDRYRIDIVDTASNRTIWSTPAAPPRENDFFSIVVPRRFLEPGTYRIEVHGLEGSAEERLATYSLRVPER